MRILLFSVLGFTALLLFLGKGVFANNKLVKTDITVVNRLNPIPGFSADDVDSIYSKVCNFLEGTRISIGIIEGDKATFFGLNKRNDTLFNENNSELLFEIGSITKVMTAHVMCSLVEEGRIDLNTSILEYIPVKNERLSSISLQHLANHTSGLPRLPNNLGIGALDPYKYYGPIDLIKYLESIDQDLEIGKESVYSNLGFGLLGYALELVSKQSLENLYQRYIFAPVNMDKSSTQLDLEDEIAEPGLSSWGIKGNYWNFDVLAGAGAIKSSSSEMLKYLQKLSGGSPEVMRLRSQTYQNEHYSLGNALVRSKSMTGDSIYWHNGGTGGFRSCMAFQEEKQIGVIVLSNVNGLEKNSDNIDAMCFELLRSRIKD
ncbi:MAG: CubicO group peptidase (beta-lactamase class C family) [Saprospiraceae bacterium]|jgi:CubicO group peptidase (beta-lactamase class C family)